MPLVREIETWKSTLRFLENSQIPRVLVPHFNDAVSQEQMIYCDAFELAIRAV